MTGETEEGEAAAGVAGCPNCGEPVRGPYCAQCGQELEPRHGPFWSVVSELLSEWMSIDGRLVRSMRALFRPGRLSTEYVAGRRAPYLRPFRLYLLASVILFSTLLTLEAPDPSGLTIEIAGRRVEPPAAAESGVQRRLQLLDSDALWNRWLLDWLEEPIARFVVLPPAEMLDVLFRGFRRMLPLSLILFLPLLAAALKLLYARRRTERHLYLDHLVFAVHFQSALFLALSLAWVASRLAGVELLGRVFMLVTVGVTVLFVYLPLALRRFYGQSRRWTAVKTVLLTFAYSWLLGFVVDLSAIVAIWGA